MPGSDSHALGEPLLQGQYTRSIKKTLLQECVKACGSQDSEAERDDAVRRFNDMEARWNEEKMRKRAAALFGLLAHCIHC